MRKERNYVIALAVAILVLVFPTCAFADDSGSGGSSSALPVVSDGVNEYYNLYTAIQHTTTGNLVLLDDVNQDVGIIIGDTQSICIDFAGHKIVLPSETSQTTLENSGILTLYDSIGGGILDMNDGDLINWSTGMMITENVKVVQASRLQNIGVLTISGDSVIEKDSAAYFLLMNKGTCTIAGNTVLNTTSAAVENSGTLYIGENAFINGYYGAVNNHATLIITGGHIMSTRGSAISVNNRGNLTVSGGLIETKHSSHHALIITDSFFTENNGSDRLSEINITGGEFFSSRSPIYIDVRETDYGTAPGIKVDISKSAVIPYDNVIEVHYSDKDNQSAAVSITPPDGYRLLLTLDETNMRRYSFNKELPTNPVVSDGQNTYFSVNDAIASAPYGSTLTILSDFNAYERISVDENQSFTIDLAGHTVIFYLQNDRYALLSRGNLTLTDSIGSGLINLNGSELTIRENICIIDNIHLINGRILNMGELVIKGNSFIESTDESYYGILSNSGKCTIQDNALLEKTILTSANAKIIQNGGSESASQLLIKDNATIRCNAAEHCDNIGVIRNMSSVTMTGGNVIGNGQCVAINNDEGASFFMTGGLVKSGRHAIGIHAPLGDSVEHISVNLAGGAVENDENDGRFPSIVFFVGDSTGFTADITIDESVSIEYNNVIQVYSRVGDPVAITAPSGYSVIGQPVSSDSTRYSFVPQSAPAVSGTVTAANVSANPGNQVQMEVSITGNPGILGLTLGVSYDSGLTLTGASAGEAFPGLTLTKPGKFTSPCNFVWDGQDLDPANIKDGVILILTFDVSDQVQPRESLTVSLHVVDGDAVDENLNPVQITTINGTVTVDAGSSYLVGDVNGDGEVNAADLTVLARHVAQIQLITDAAVLKSADVNDDREVNSKDLTLLAKYVAKIISSF